MFYNMFFGIFPPWLHTRARSVQFPLLICQYDGVSKSAGF